MHRIQLSFLSPCLFLPTFAGKSQQPQVTVPRNKRVMLCSLRAVQRNYKLHQTVHLLPMQSSYLKFQRVWVSELFYINLDLFSLFQAFGKFCRGSKFVWLTVGTALAQFGNTFPKPSQRCSQTKPRQCFLYARISFIKKYFWINNGILSGCKHLALTREHIAMERFLAWFTQLAQ